jgi:hypothetical protein
LNGKVGINWNDEGMKKKEENADKKKRITKRNGGEERE